MAVTYEPIATTTLSSAASSITFSSIPSTYTDLKVILVGNSSVDVTAQIQFNSDTATNYSRTRLYGNGTSALSAASTNQTAGSVSAIYAAQKGVIQIDVFSYAGSTYKTYLSSGANDQNGSGIVENIVGLWRSTSAINTVTLKVSSGDFATGTIATIYGIKAA
jgi:hypothetical protein